MNFFNRRRVDGLLSDAEITELCREGDMLSPFVDHKVNTGPAGEKILSYGLEPTGYTLRLSNEFKIVKDPALVVDPKQVTAEDYRELRAIEAIEVPRNNFVLGRTVEYFKMPGDVLGVVYGKSTYLRCGVETPISIIEPGWHGHLVIEIANNGANTARVYVNEGICQVIFFRASRAPKLAYLGRYQGQRGVQIAKGG